MTAKRSITLHGHRTSISLEDPFWDALQDIAQSQDVPLAQLVQSLDDQRLQQKNMMGLSSFLRIHILNWYRGK